MLDNKECHVYLHNHFVVYRVYKLHFAACTTYSEGAQLFALNIAATK